VNVYPRCAAPHKIKRNEAGEELMGVPNMFILGAGKCGTTTLWRILSHHPDIHMSATKEPTFFCSYYQNVKDPVSYSRLFDNPARYRSEASHAYFSNPQTARVLRELFPDAKFIVILRNPKNRAYSLYRHMRRHRGNRRGHEKIKTFFEALSAEETRFRSKEFFDNCPQYFWNFLYCRSSFYDEQLARYFALFDRKQFHVMTLAELARDTAGEIEGILSFLNVPKEPLKNFKLHARNESPEGAYEPMDAASAAFMEKRFEGLTGRVDRLIGRSLDWSK
jgi:Sulfotransferase domain